MLAASGILALASASMAGQAPDLAGAVRPGAARCGHPADDLAAADAARLTGGRIHPRC